ncbi:MAG: bifunctional aspartate kinase/homoserine dehydrogenase I [Treponema sp.]|jgi:aspartokinase/homoserine dehydrogenase 1|nr:bifunctional aspartate kinase/homoserine dehydrogenase I [Treponema sp.]
MQNIKSWKIMKFGGTSVGIPSAVKRIIDIVRNEKAVVVASAFSGVTDTLIELARKCRDRDNRSIEILEDLRKRHYDMASSFLSADALNSAIHSIEKPFSELKRILDGVSALEELSPRSLDNVMSFGERFSASILTEIFRENGINAEYLDARPLVKTDDTFGKARFLEQETFENIKRFFAEHQGTVFVATGFIGSTLEGVTTTLGRGGSDLSAGIFGAALDSEVVEIWTDVDGILSADPKIVKNAFRIKEISYIEAMELSHFGAKVLYPPTVRPALEKGIPIWIRNTFNPQGGGTRIKNKAEDGDFPIRGVTSMNQTALVRVQGSGMVGVAGFSSRLFGAIARKNINIILITQSSSEYSICFAILPKDLTTAQAELEEEFAYEMQTGVIEPIETQTDLAIIAIVGSNMWKISGNSGKVFHALGRNGVNIIAIAQGSSELNISAVIKREDEAKAVNAIHEAFFLSGSRSVNLFLVGTGLIGGTLLEQLASHREILADKHKICVNLTGVADSKQMLFSAEGLDPKTVKLRLKAGERTPKELCSSGEQSSPFDIDGFIAQMKAFNLPNTAFCDCTASDAIAAKYEAILTSAIPIVTPNKRANSGSLDYYHRLIDYSRNRGIPYLYETTVCAGLPVISTLRDLFLSGDRVNRIEAVLSGTLSFIFNNFDGSRSFSELVREAKSKGYTEPDPRDDLNAMDAARKALVLARECGIPLEFSAVSIEPILPPACFAASGVEAFWRELEKADADFERRRLEAQEAGKELRYVAVIERGNFVSDGSAKISLREEDENSPFRSLTDADNMVVITSDRYSTLPMVIKGPGAGAQVTAGGVFADIARIARTLV